MRIIICYLDNLDLQIIEVLSTVPCKNHANTDKVIVMNSFLFHIIQVRNMS